jgi:predicted ribosome quality control (RQC) complex YloA/Tae2 family protein
MGSSIELKFESGVSIVVALGRRARNVLLVSAEAVSEAALFQDDNTIHKIGERFSESGEDELTELATVTPTAGESMSDLLDRHYTESASADEFEKLAASARRKVSGEIAKRRKLLKNLALDIERHGDAVNWKRFGDLLLANAATARRDGDTISVADFFDAETPQIQIEGDRNKEIPEIAESYFRKYTKARNAAAVIKERVEIIDKEILKLDERLVEVERAIERRDAYYLSGTTGEKRKAPESKPKKTDAEIKGVRRFISTDGFEILVGKKATDNDYLSFRIAKSHDLWMHAADYPGSHVVVRNPNKKEIPQRTLLEAAELAAFYSSGKKQTKAAVNYTLKKHINKPRRSAPGLVSLSSFKTILVEPKIRLKSET